MNDEGIPPSDQGGPDGSLDLEVGRVIDAYLAELEAGRGADRARLLSANPDLADRLWACLELMDLFDRVAESPELPLRGSPSGIRAGARLPNDLGTDSGTTWWTGPDAPPRLLLRDPPGELVPLVRPRSGLLPEPVDDGDRGIPGRYQVLGEIARGGMGVVLKARDVDLGRDLAIKVLMHRHRNDLGVIRRFVEEAQIGGQLQHPGIVPVHELSASPNRPPYFTMKLVKGQTLAALLHDRPDPAKDLPRFLAIFEQMCQTMAYAHARGVIHRDLKPSNVMVGSFGEVQVMDWGLAKVLPQGGVADETRTQPTQETVIMTVRSGSAGSGSESQAGSVLGTPAYMAPEQARGEVERIDERADVFGLGAILCEILTGRSLYVGSTREEIRARAARGELAEALGRLEACGADPEMIELAKDCLAPERDQRLRNASAVARRTTAYLAGVQDRLKAAELARVEAQTRAEEAQSRAAIERSRRWRTVALAVSVLITAVVLGGGWTYLVQQRAEHRAATERGVTAALTEARVWRDQARKAAANGILESWTTALAAARHARDLVVQDAAEVRLRNRVEAELIALEHDHEEAKAERRLLDELETIRGNRSEHWDPKRTDTEYATAFRTFGIDLDRLEPTEAGLRIAKKSASEELGSYLDDWTIVRRTALPRKDAASWRQLLATARVADPDPWRVALRDQIGRDDPMSLRLLAADQEALEAQPARSLDLLGQALESYGDRGLAQEVLQRAWRRAPGDFWVNFHLGLAHYTVNGFDRPEDAARFFSAAVAIRPRSSSGHNNLGNALREQGRREEAIAEYRTALHLKPDDAEVHNNIGVVLSDQGRLDEAAAEYRKALLINPELPAAHNNLGIDHANQGRVEEAISEFRQALLHGSDSAQIHNNLGKALYKRGRPDEAIPEYREALRLEPDYLNARVGLGNASLMLGRLEDAVGEFHAAIRLRPQHREAHYNLGQALRTQGEFALAMAEFRKARDLGRTDPALVQQIEHDLTQTEQQAFLAARLPALLAGKLKPADTAEMVRFAQLCYKKELYDASARLWAEAFQSQPRLAEEMRDQHRYNAACAAALAGFGQGKDDPPLDGAAKGRWRKQAVDWLETDLASWARQLGRGRPEDRAAVQKTLTHWKQDSDLAGLRDPASLGILDRVELDALRALWAQVEELLARAHSQGSPGGLH